eukprot:SAG31_NODE_5376_length_2576_cov_1.998385_1_plen_220_part_00
MLKEGAKQFSGVEEAVLKNIQACKELAVMVRTSMGPNGMNKMVINHLERLFVTSDARTIITELEVAHPAAKILALSANRQWTEIGDGAGLVVAFAGELLTQAESLLHMGLHPADILDGYVVAAAKADGLLDTLAIETITDFTEEACLRVVKPAFSSKNQGEGCCFLLFVQLFEKYGTLIESNTALIENVSPCRDAGLLRSAGCASLPAAGAARRHDIQR